MNRNNSRKNRAEELTVQLLGLTDGRANWLKSKLFNKSEIARLIGMRPSTLTNKINNLQGQRITPSDLVKLESVKKKIFQELLENIF
jgi:hypothetical protein